MKELVNRYKPQVHPLQRDVSLVVTSHFAHGQLNKLDPNPSSLLNNIFGPEAKLIFPTEGHAAKAVVGLFASTLDVFWDKKSTNNVREQQLIDNIRLLKNQGISKAEIVERLSLHFHWRLNSQKI